MTRRAPRLRLTVQYAGPRAGLPAPATVRRWAAAALERDAAVTVRFAGAREGAHAERDVPRQGLRDERADVRVR